MPSFDFASKVDLQTLDNAVNVVHKEISNRFDFKGCHVVIDLNKKEFKLNLESDSDMKIGQIIDVLISRSIKQGLAAEIYDLSKEPYVSGKVTKQEVLVRNGIKQEDAKKIVKLIKDLGKGESKFDTTRIDFQEFLEIMIVKMSQKDREEDIKKAFKLFADTQRSVRYL